MKINVADFEDFLKNNTWDIFASEEKDSKLLRLYYNADGFYRVIYGSDEVYFGTSHCKAVDTYDTFSN